MTKNYSQTFTAKLVCREQHVCVQEKPHVLYDVYTYSFVVHE